MFVVFELRVCWSRVAGFYRVRPPSRHMLAYGLLGSLYVGHYGEDPSIPRLYTLPLLGLPPGDELPPLTTLE